MSVPVFLLIHLQPAECEQIMLIYNKFHDWFLFRTIWDASPYPSAHFCLFQQETADMIHPPHCLPSGAQARQWKIHYEHS